MKKLSEILKYSLEVNASDLIFAPNFYPSLKINWDVVTLSEDGIFLEEDTQREILWIMTEKQKAKLIEDKEIDFSITLKDYSRFRVNVFMQKDWYSAVFRPIKSEIADFWDLWLPEVLKTFLERKNWLILVTWSVWSGKSTTLSSLVDYINNNYYKHIITIEDPIEYVFENNKSIIEQREVWVNTNSFDNWLKYALRQASDVIMIGEMRDLETFRLALRAAETWNLVLATLHTSGAARSVSRIVDMFPWDEKDKIRTQLSESLIGVIWQDLLKSSDEKSRVLVSEVLVNNTSISNMIRKWTDHQINSAIDTWSEYWMLTMKKSLEDIYSKKLISKEVFDKSMSNLKRLS